MNPAEAEKVVHIIEFLDLKAVVKSSTQSADGRVYSM